MNPVLQPNTHGHLSKLLQFFSRKTIIISGVIAVLIIVLLIVIFSFVLKPHSSYSTYRYIPSNTRGGTNISPTTGAPGQTGSGGNPSWNSPMINMIMEAQNLSSCSSTSLFNYPIAQPGTYKSINPLGHSSSYNGNAAHVIPVDHMYVNLKLLAQHNDGTANTVPATVYAPANVELYQLADVTTRKNGVVYNEDYTLYFSPCKQVTVYLGHIDSISDTIKNALTTAQKYCKDPFTIDGIEYTTCTYGLSLNLKSGDVIGSAGGNNHPTISFDLGVYDTRIKPLAFIDTKYETQDNLQAVCGLNYYQDGQVKNSLFNTIDNTKKDSNGLPDCGSNMQDIPGTLQGNWYLPNTPTNQGVPNTSAIVIDPLSTDPSTGLIDWGGNIAPADEIQYTPTTSGIKNREASEVTPDGKVYCYQSSSYIAGSIVLQLVDNNTLKIQLNKAACSANPVLTSPTTYIR